MVDFSVAMLVDGKVDLMEPLMVAESVVKTVVTMVEMKEFCLDSLLVEKMGLQLIGMSGALAAVWMADKMVLKQAGVTVANLADLLADRLVAKWVLLSVDG